MQALRWCSIYSVAWRKEVSFGSVDWAVLREAS